MSKYLIYVSVSFEVEGSDEVEAKKLAEPILKKLEEESNKLNISFKVDSAKVADKKSGFFV